MYINNPFNKNVQEEMVSSDVFFKGLKKMTIDGKNLLAFIEEPATYHFLLALVIFLVGVSYPSAAHVLNAIAAFCGVTGVITYNQ